MQHSKGVSFNYIRALPFSFRDLAIPMNFVLSWVLLPLLMSVPLLQLNRGERMRNRDGVVIELAFHLHVFKRRFRVKHRLFHALNIIVLLLTENKSRILP